MKLILTRTRIDENGAFGALRTAEGSLVCYTLEHAYGPGPEYTPKLPAGEYICHRGMHALHDGLKFETFEVTGVVGHSGILFHVGNTQKDSEGCILVGTARGTNNIANSRDGFIYLLKELQGQEQFILEVI